MSLGQNPRKSWNAHLCSCHAEGLVSSRRLRVNLVSTGTLPFNAANPIGDSKARNCTGELFFRRATDVIDYTFVLNELTAPITGIHIHDNDGNLIVDLAAPQSSLLNVKIVGRVTTAHDSNLATKIDAIAKNPANYYVDLVSGSSGHVTALAAPLA